MCFSATASFTASGLLAIIGLLSMKYARTASMRLFAATPLFFALQQATEGILWLIVPTVPISLLQTACTYLYLFFAYLFWPIWIPLIMMRLETTAWRRAAMRWLLGCGVIVAAIGLTYILTTYATAQIVEGHFSYAIGESGNGWVSYYDYYWILKLLYCATIMLSLWLSSMPNMRLLAIGTTIGYAATQLWYMFYFASVWCFFTALVSGLVFVVIRRTQK